MESQPRTAKEPEIELFVKVGLGVGRWLLLGSSPRAHPPQALAGCRRWKFVGVLAGWRWAPSLPITCHEGCLSGCPEEGTRHMVARRLVRYHAQHPKRCPGLALVMYPTGMALLVAGVGKEWAHVHLSKPR